MLTPKQQKVFNWIVDFLKHRGRSPSLAEISKGNQLNSSYMAHYYVTQLIGKNLLARRANVPNSIRIVSAEAAARDAEHKTYLKGVADGIRRKERQLQAAREATLTSSTKDASIEPLQEIPLFLRRSPT